MRYLKAAVGVLSLGVLGALCALCARREPPQVLCALALGIIVHEAGHAIAMKVSGVAIKGLIFLPFGAIIDTGKRSCPYLAECGIYLAGPMAGFIAAALFWRRADPAEMNVAFCFSVLSLGLSCFNLLPIPGLDGAGALRALLLHTSDNANAAIRAVRVVQAVFTVLFFLLAGALWLGWGIGEYPLLLGVFFLLRLFCG